MGDHVNFWLGDFWDMITGRGNIPDSNTYKKST
jgi:hypothetical protein